MRAPQWPLPSWMVGASLLSDKQIAEQLTKHTQKLIDAAAWKALHFRDARFDSNLERSIILEAARRLEAR